MRYPITLLSFFLILLLSVGCGNSKKARKEATASVPGDFAEFIILTI